MRAKSCCDGGCKFFGMGDGKMISLQSIAVAWAATGMVSCSLESSASERRSGHSSASFSVSQFGQLSFLADSRSSARTCEFRGFRAIRHKGDIQMPPGKKLPQKDSAPLSSGSGWARAGPHRALGRSRRPGAYGCAGRNWPTFSRVTNWNGMSTCLSKGCPRTIFTAVSMAARPCPIAF